MTLDGATRYKRLRTNRDENIDDAIQSRISVALHRGLNIRKKIWESFVKKAATAMAEKITHPLISTASNHPEKK